MISNSLGGLDLAAGAMSKAIGDIFRGQNEAIEMRPDTFAKAEALAGAEQRRAIQMAKLPMDIARDQQQVKLGEYALERAPFEFDRMKKLAGWEDMERGWKLSDRYSIDQARHGALKFREAALADPNTPLEDKRFLEANTNPDAILQYVQRTSEAAEKSRLQRELEDLKAKHQTALKKFELDNQKFTLENQIVDAMRSGKPYTHLITAYKDMHGTDAKVENQALKLELASAKNAADIARLEALTRELDANPEKERVKAIQHTIDEGNRTLREELRLAGKMTPELQLKFDALARLQNRLNASMRGAPTQPKTAKELFDGMFGSR